MVTVALQVFLGGYYSFTIISSQRFLLFLTGQCLKCLEILYIYVFKYIVIDSMKYAVDSFVEIRGYIKNIS